MVQANIVSRQTGSGALYICSGGGIRGTCNRSGRHLGIRRRTPTPFPNVAWLYGLRITITTHSYGINTTNLFNVLTTTAIETILPNCPENTPCRPSDIQQTSREDPPSPPNPAHS